MEKTGGVFSGRDYYPGEGGSNNYFKKSSSGLSINYEQHASVPKVEELGLNALGYKIVDVSQKLTINFDNKSGNLSVNAYTNIYPSATLKLNNTNTTLMNYQQPSFNKTHGVPYKVGQKQDFSYYPAKFYKRN